MNQPRHIPESCSAPQTPVAYSALSATEQEQILRLQQDILDSVAMGTEHEPIVNQVCQLEEHLLPNSVASVMLLDPSGSKLDVYAAPSIPPEAIARLNDLHPGPAAGSCGNVIYRQEPVFVANTRVDPRWADLRSVAEDFNICACWSMPVRVNGQVIGTFALSSFEQRAPSPFHRKLLEIGASIIGIVLERGRAQASLRLSAQVFENSSEGIIITDRDTRILKVNRTFTKVTGYNEAEALGQTPAMLGSGAHDANFYRAMWGSVKHFGGWQGEIVNRRKDGSTYPQWLSISTVHDSNGELTHYIGMFSDLSEHKHAQERIAYLSSHDELTGLSNRQDFATRLNLALGLASRSGACVALLEIDLDNFKLLNETLGHASGDRLLQKLAERLQHNLRPGDFLGRQGGDEFLVALTSERDSAAVSSVCSELLATLSQQVELGGTCVSLSASIGVALSPADGSDFATLYRKADSALAHAKKIGRDTFRFYDKQMNADSLAYLELSGRMHEALAAGEFELHYQPQIDLTSGRLNGAEALVRWRHPQRGMLSPAVFIPIAEASGFIVPLGEWVLETACRQAAAWLDAGRLPGPIAVNLSGVQFRRGDVAACVERMLKDAGLAPEYLELEITESVMMEDTERMLTQVQALKALGLSLAIDDFGTGYSSLAYLKRFAVDRLKIDRCFVRDMSSNPDDAAIVQAVIRMADILRLNTIAEGIETPEQLAALRACGCHAAQGYYFARPLPVAEFEAFMANARQF